MIKLMNNFTLKQNGVEVNNLIKIRKFYMSKPDLMEKAKVTEFREDNFIKNNNIEIEINDEKDTINLTEKEINDLRDFKVLLEIKNNNLIDEDGFIKNDENYNFTSIEESFPSLENSDVGIFNSLKNISDVNSLTIFEIIKQKGLNALNKFKFESSNTNTILELEKDITDLKAQYAKLEKELEMGTHSSNIIINGKDLTNNLDQGIELFRKGLQTYLDNQSIINMGISASAIISPVLAYKSLLNLHMKHTFPENHPKYNTVKINQIMQLRKETLKSFNRVALPALSLYYLYYLYIGHYHKVFSLNLNLNLNLAADSGTTAMIYLPFLSKYNLPNWMKVLLVPVICFTGYWTIPSIINYLSPSLYMYLAKLISYGPYWLTYPILLWLVGSLLFQLLEFYLFMLFSVDRKNITIPEYLPQFILNWINSIKEKSKFDIKREIINSYIKILLFYSLVILLCMYFFII